MSDQKTEIRDCTFINTPNPEQLKFRIRELEAENAALREALDGIYIYANDTLSGRTDGGADNRDWQRAAVVEIRDRALADKGEGYNDDD